MVLELIKRIRQGLSLSDRNPGDYILHLPEAMHTELMVRIKPSSYRFTPPTKQYGPLTEVAGILVTLSDDDGVHILPKGD